MQAIIYLHPGRRNWLPIDPDGNRSGDRNGVALVDAEDRLLFDLVSALLRAGKQIRDQLDA
jgi:hypothetical protein